MLQVRAFHWWRIKSEATRSKMVCPKSQLKSSKIWNNNRTEIAKNRYWPIT